MSFSAEAVRQLQEIRQKYPDRTAALLPALYIAQKEFGSLSAEAIKAVSRELDIPKAAIKGTSTFYSMLKNKNLGRNIIQICTNVSCMIFGAETLVELIKKRYNLTPGGTSPDGRFSLIIMECIGACDRAPAMLVNTAYHPDLNEKNIVEILESYK